MSLNLGAKFLQAPLIRISGSSCLNDPFEFQLTTSSSSKVESVLRESLKNEYDHSEIMKRFWTHGIISLTETNDNLLMWSHYADEHKGMLVSFEIDLNSPFYFFAIHEEHESCYFSKVNYRKFRQFNTEVSIDNLDEVKLHYMLSKSDEWIYEKEHRFVIPFHEADVILLDKGNELFNDVLSDLGVNGSEVESLEDKAFIDVRKFRIEKSALFKIWVLSSHVGAMFFKIVNPDAIKSVYLGCKVDSNSTRSLFEEHIQEPIKSTFYDSDKSSIRNVYKSSLNSDRFELEFSTCSASFLDYLS